MSKKCHISFGDTLRDPPPWSVTYFFNATLDKNIFGAFTPQFLTGFN
jgi:hypothetical protein